MIGPRHQRSLIRHQPIPSLFFHKTDKIHPITDSLIYPHLKSETWADTSYDACIVTRRLRIITHSGATMTRCSAQNTRRSVWSYETSPDYGSFRNGSRSQEAWRLVMRLPPTKAKDLHGNWGCTIYISVSTDISLSGGLLLRHAVSRNSNRPLPSRDWLNTATGRL